MTAALAAGRLTLLAAAVLLALTWSIVAAGPAAADPCANEGIRIEQGALGLADCRAYELVTPGALVGDDTRPARAAVGGGALTYFTNHPAPDADSSAFYYLARRGSGGWSFIVVGRQNAAAARYQAICEQNVFFSPDLSKNILEAGWFDPDEPAKCKHTEEPIVPGEPRPHRNVFVHDVATDAHQLVNVTPDGAIPANASFQDASDDLGQVLFAEAAKLTPEAPAGNNLYIWSGGSVRLVTFLPDGSPAAGELVEGANLPGGPGSGFAPLTGAVSEDGRRVFFYSDGGLYLRENAGEPQSAIAGGECSEPARACTVRVDASQGPGPSGGGVFWRATADGSVVYFTAESKLTADSTAEVGKPDLYRYVVDSGALADLTVNAGEPAGVRGLSGMSEDGSYLYFVANGVLAPGASPGDCPGPEASPGHCNLYLLHEGSIEFIASLSRRDSFAWQENPNLPLGARKTNNLWANPSPSGRYLAFASYESLTGYGTGAEREIFVYDAAANGGAGSLSCASCPTGPALGPLASLATASNYGPIPNARASWRANSVLDDGSVFFNADDALLLADTNGREDVYRYRSGELDLISSGSFAGRSRFLDASPDGVDVFFRTAEALVGEDTDNENLSLYDARIGGGFPSPPPTPSPCDSEELCRGAIGPLPALALPQTAAVRPPNKRRCARAKQRRRCHKQRGKQRRRHLTTKRRGSS